MAAAQFMQISLKKNQDFQSWFVYFNHILHRMQRGERAAGILANLKRPELFNFYMSTEAINDQFVFDDPKMICNEMLKDPHPASITRSVMGIKASAVAMRFAFLYSWMEQQIELQWSFAPNLENPRELHPVVILSNQDEMSMVISTLSLTRSSRDHHFWRHYALLGSNIDDWYDIQRWSSLGEQSYGDINHPLYDMVDDVLYHPVAVNKSHHFIASGIGCVPDSKGNFFPPKGTAVDDLMEYLDSIDPESYANRRTDKKNQNH